MPRPRTCAAVAAICIFALAACSGGGDAARTPPAPTPGAGFVRPAGIAAPFYGEIFVPETNRFVVFGTKAGMEAYKTSRELASSKTLIGFGPNRETVVFEAEKDSAQMVERLKKDFAARWNLQR